MVGVYGLIGEKLGHSHSPQIHDLILKHMGLNGTYNLFQVKKENLKFAIDGLKALNVKGVNVTIPYKVDIIRYLDEISNEAGNIGAVNTIEFNQGILKGYNTDYYGFGATLKNFNVPVKGEKAVILGTGGASKAVRQYLIDNGIKEIIYVSRNKEKKLDDFRVIEYSEIKDVTDSRVLINCTPCGMYPNIKECPIKKEEIRNFSYVLDLIYNPEETLLLRYAKEEGLVAVNGLYMLVSQAVKAQEIWQKRKLSLKDEYRIYEEIRKTLLGAKNYE